MAISEWKFSALAAAAVAVLAGCGGGGASTKLSSGDQLPSFTGTVAIGAAISNASVKIYDSFGVQVGEGSTDSSGGFKIALTKLGVAPYILNAVKDEVTLNAIFSKDKDGQVNITPLSDAVVNMLYPGSNDVVALLTSGTAAPTAEEIVKKQDLIKAAISPLVTAIGTNSDIFSSAFVANGTGLDKVLDTLSITKNISEGGNLNLELAFKTSTNPLTATASNQTISLNSNSTAEQVNSQVSGVTISAGDLPPDNMGGLYNDFLQRLNACYQLPPAQRTNGTTSVVAPVCKSIFVDADPLKYLHGGATVGKNGAFGGMFSYSGAVEFKSTVKPYLVQDIAGVKSADGKGRAIISYSWINTDGNRENVPLYVTKYVLEGKEVLGASGDQNIYGFFVNSHNQKFEFPLRGDSSLDYVLGNYLLAVRDVNDGSGNSIVRYARVTTPSGKTVLMAPAPGGGRRDLQICTLAERTVLDNQAVPRSANCNGSKAITMSERFVANGDNRKPSEVFSSPALVRPLDVNGQPYSPGESEVLRLPAMGLWSVEYTFNDNTTLTQKTWSVARPMTIGELMGPAGPDAVVGRLTNVSSLKALKQSPLMTPCAQGDAACIAEQSPIPAPSTGGYQMEWVSGSLPITSLWVSGAVNGKLFNGNYKPWVSGRDNKENNTFVNSSRWDDQRNVLSSTRSAQVMCSRQSNADAHCAGGVATGSTGNFFEYVWMSYSELWGRDEQQRTLMRSYNWYQPTFNVGN